jgi:cytochrome P450
MPRRGARAGAGEIEPAGVMALTAIDADRALAINFDLKRLDQAFLDDPYPTYRALRDHDPVHRMPDGSYMLTRYADCVEVYRNAAVWSSDKRVEFRANFADSLLYEHHTTSLVFNDPPAHTRVRKLLMPAFAPRALKALEPRIESLVDRLLEQAAERSHIDLIEDFAAAIPVQLIGDLLGIPSEERGALRGWSLAILGALEPVLRPEQFVRGAAAVNEFKDYLTDLIDRGCGADSPGTILPTLVAASDFAGLERDETERLSAIELLHNCIFLLNAGHETTTNLIGNSIDLLLRHPEAMAELRADLRLIDTAVEEFLRMESSNQLGNRRAREDTELGGTPMPAGTYVHIGIGAANRDPAVFPEPDRLDIRRQPNRHLGFGSGVHTCAGMSLARMEAQVAIGKLLQRFATIERAGPVRRSGRARFRGFLNYPLYLA